MILVKFIVLFGCISVFSALQTYYCEICLNHTLCLYKLPGPSAACQSYKSAALLSNRDIKDLVHNINDRRNFIAKGLSKILPPAANMKKIHWSRELAKFAQRWADQCDASLHPDKEDDCRDLGENTQVGQNIASIAGSSAGLYVKSFVEMWFMQILDYDGTVTYYNQSQDHKANYLTQMIWAETEFVGCGKVKFYALKKQTMIERLVCNFAPKGNIHAKPIYIIGHHGTQCDDDMAPDDEYEGLCKHRNLKIGTNSSTPKSSSNLLQILNLSNDSLRQDIDPIRNNLKVVNFKSKIQRNQKIRHILSNNSYDSMGRIPLHRPNHRKSIIQNMSRNMNDDEYLYQPERGHSRLYHGHDEIPRHDASKPSYLKTHYFQGNNNQDFRRYDYMTTPIYLIASSNYRKYHQNQQCTRKIKQTYDCCNNNKQRQCTRGQPNCCHQYTICQRETFTNPIIPDDSCSCTTKCPTTCLTTCPPLCTTFNNCNINCNCKPHNNILNMVRSGNFKPIEDLSTPNEDLAEIHDSKMSKEFKAIREQEDNNRSHKKTNDKIIHPKYKPQDYDYVYGSLDTSLRKKRQVEDEITLTPFWKINNINHRKALEIKTLKYTTLSNRKKMESIIWPIITEPITISTDDQSEGENDNDELSTEKYLSFEELMYLRKLNDEYMDDYTLRRTNKNKSKNKKTTTKKSKKETTKSKTNKKSKTEKTTKKAVAKTTAKKTTAKPTTKKTANTTPAKKAPATVKTTTTVKPTALKLSTAKAQSDPISNNGINSTPEYTANTPFVRKKHCTRKLTCTWTAFTGTADGNGNQNGPIDFGSRTPPGYVDGCTRTSTCTRDFMDRNKMASLPDRVNDTNISDENYSGSPGEDEEYCERRFLQKRKIHSNNRNVYSNAPIYRKSNTPIRQKRQKISWSKDNTKIMSYADLYYLILSKIINTNGSKSYNTKTCPCNCAARSLPFGIYCTISYLIKSNIL